MLDVPTAGFEDGGSSALDDITLAAMAMGDGAVAQECFNEVEARARAGSAGLQRVLVYAGLRLWASGRISTDRLLEDAEPFARAVSRTSRDADLELLATLLSIRADLARERGDAAQAHSCAVEALTLIGTVANGTDDPQVAERATQDFHEMAKGFSPDAKEQAEHELWVRATVEIDQQDEPEVSVFKRIKGDTK